MPKYGIMLEECVISEKLGPSEHSRLNVRMCLLLGFVHVPVDDSLHYTLLNAAEPE